MSKEQGSVRSQIGPYSLVPEWVLDSDLSDRAVRLYALLGRYADDEGKAFPSRRTLAKRLKCSVDSVDRAVRELTEGKILLVEHRYEDGDETHRQTSNTYALVQVPRRTGAAGEGGTTAAPPGRKAAAPGTRTSIEREPVEEQIERMRERAATERVWTVDRKPVSWDHAVLAQKVLAAWNELAGQDLRSRDWLAKIVMRVREYPEATLDDHRLIIETALKDPWWKGPSSPSVVYGNGAQFERAIQQVRTKRRDDTRIERIVNRITEGRAA